MPITIYGIKNCDTMKKARAWLDKHGVKPAGASEGVTNTPACSGAMHG
jgi:arsenate reductase-like glutaredoxin family protein